VTATGGLEALVVKALGLPSGVSAAQVNRILSQATDEWLTEVFGPHATAAQMAAPEADAIYQETMLQGYSVGLRRASAMTGLGTPAFIPARNSSAVRELITGGFRRLSEGGRIRLGDRIIEGCMDTLGFGLQQGAGPEVIARMLAEKFDAYTKWEFQRLARTELAEAHVKGLVDEFGAEGVQAGPKPLPTYHPNCTCAVKVVNGLMVPDVSATACPTCQAYRE